ncbi:MAG: hypothetical protein QOC65_687, partial [Sphingomonadales bacterium]|nr:hypothetical protein [Sphingomonadales bacterium]
MDFWGAVENEAAMADLYSQLGVERSAS